MSRNLLALLGAKKDVEDPLHSTLQFLVDTNSRGQCYINQSKRIQYVNPAFCNDFVGLNSVIVGRHLRELFGRDSYNLIHRLIQDARYSTSEPLRRTITITDQLSGFEKTLDVAVLTHLDGDSEVQGYVITVDSSNGAEVHDELPPERNDDLVIQRYLYKSFFFHS